MRRKKHILFSLSVKVEKYHFLPHLFKRFTKLNTLDLTHFNNDHNLDMLLHQISNFPLKLTSLKLPKSCRFPAKGLQDFSQNITTLTSLTCSIIFLSNNNISLIADCFPLLKELNLDHPLVINKANFINSFSRMLSQLQCIQHLELCSTYFLNDQHVVDFSLFLGNMVSINLNKC
jgi:hypothetical protein